MRTGPSTPIIVIGLALIARLLPAADPPGTPELFVEVQDQVGIDFRHIHGGSGRRYMIETMTGGVALLDFDQDGWQDIYFVQSGPLPGFPDQTPLPNRLYRNRGDGTFQDVTQGSAAGDSGYGVGVCSGDYDNDGWPDLYVTNLEQDALLRNRGDGTFEDVTGAAGIDSPRYGSSCAFADYDRDGCLDLFVVNFVDFTPENHIDCGAGDLRTYCSPDVYDGLPDQLYRNSCDGSFADVSIAAGVVNPDPRQGKGLGVLWTDHNADGWLDIYVANDSTRNFLYLNRQDGTFEDVGLITGTAFNNRGQTEASMGVDAGDFDGDGLIDLFMTHLDFETNTLFRNLGRGLFIDSTNPAGLASPSATRVGFGTNFLDFDHDGDLDLFIANGHILDNATEKNSSLSYEQTNQLMSNEGGRFVDVSASAGGHFKRARVGRGTAAGDLDNDGDLDLVIVNSNREAVVLDNVNGTRGGHWIQLDLRSRHGGREAIGATVRLVAGERSWTDEIRSGASYLSQSDLRLHFGLLDLESVDRLEIRWPDGDDEVVDGSELEVDQVNRLTQQPAQPETERDNDP